MSSRDHLHEYDIEAEDIIFQIELLIGIWNRPHVQLKTITFKILFLGLHII